MTPCPMQRIVREIVSLPSRNSGKYRFSVACFVLKVCQDDLADLLLYPHPQMPKDCQQGLIAK